RNDVVDRRLRITTFGKHVACSIQNLLPTFGFGDRPLLGGCPLLLARRGHENAVSSLVALAPSDIDFLLDRGAGAPVQGCPTGARAAASAFCPPSALPCVQPA